MVAFRSGEECLGIVAHSLQMQLWNPKGRDESTSLSSPCCKLLKKYSLFQCLHVVAFFSVLKNQARRSVFCLVRRDADFLCMCLERSLHNTPAGRTRENAWIPLSN